MKTASLSLILMLLFSFCASAKEVINIVTAQERGTYYQIARDIQKIAPEDIEIRISPSVGSFTNALLVATSPDDNQMGMLQQNIFDSLQGELADAIKLALPLYNEEIHLVARNSIKKLSDLNGKKVAVDIQGTGTFSVVERLLKKAGLDAVEQVYLGGEAAVNALKDKQIDAMFYVVGYPAPVFKTLSNEFHLLPMTLSLGEGFQMAIIPAKTYRWQPREVRTISVPMVLVTHNYKSSSEACGRVGQVAQAIYEQLDWLKQNGHEKWREVLIDPEALSQNEAVSPCVVNALNLN